MKKIETYDEEIKLYIWINGKESDSTFSILLDDHTNSLRRLKDLIGSNLKMLRQFSDKMLIFNCKGLELDDSDIPYLINGQVLYVSLDGSPFSTLNYVYEYLFVQWIKSGGFGKVYLAQHSLKKDLYVAIKKIDVSNLSTDEIYNISREALYLESFNHKHIIKFIKTFIYENTFYTIMEHAQGGELSSYINEKGILSEKETKKIFKQIHEAVKYIHSRNVIHRDLKPNNILFLDTNRENIVLIDFGISGYNSGNVREKIKVGTTKFIPPELASGITYSSSPKFDAWALGVILFLMLFGYYPFDGSKDSEIVNKIINHKHKFPDHISVTKIALSLLNGLLEKNSQMRLEMNDPLFEQWYEDESALEIPTIKEIHKPANPLSVNTEFEENGFQLHYNLNINTPYSNNLKNTNNGLSLSISPKKRNHQRVKSISVIPNNTNTSVLKTVNKASPRSTSIGLTPASSNYTQSKNFFISRGQNILNSSTNIKKNMNISKNGLNNKRSTLVNNISNINFVQESLSNKSTLYKYK